MFSLSGLAAFETAGYGGKVNPAAPCCRCTCRCGSGSIMPHCPCGPFRFDKPPGYWPTGLNDEALDFTC